jgi:opacity protein-like surface antigen
MKKFVFAVVIAAIAASPAAAATKKKKKVVAPAPVASTNSNENSWKFAKDAFPIFLPSWSIPIYLSAKNAQ